MNAQQQYRPPQPHLVTADDEASNAVPDPLLTEAQAFGRVAAGVTQRALSGNSEKFNNESRQTGGE